MNVPSQRANFTAIVRKVGIDLVDPVNDRGMYAIPALVNGIEELFASKSGSEKKDAAVSFLENALATVDAVAAREIVDADKFRNDVSKIIDSTVDCLNASTLPGRRVDLRIQL